MNIHISFCISIVVLPKCLFVCFCHTVALDAYRTTLVQTQKLLLKVQDPSLPLLISSPPPLPTGGGGEHQSHIVIFCSQYMFLCCSHSLLRGGNKSTKHICPGTHIFASNWHRKRQQQKKISTKYDHGGSTISQTHIHPFQDPSLTF